jgi:hypothetical protein
VRAVTVNAETGGLSREKVVRGGSALQRDDWRVGHRYLSAHSLDAILANYDKDNNNNNEEVRELTAA